MRGQGGEGRSITFITLQCIPLPGTLEEVAIVPSHLLLFTAGTLKEVAIAGCRAREDAAVAVIRAATKNNSLHLLDLRGVPLGPDVSVLVGGGGEGGRHICFTPPHPLPTGRCTLVHPHFSTPAPPPFPQGVAHLCQMLRYSATLNTLRVDVASRDCAEIVARELPNNRSLMHLTMGGPVPEQVWGGK